jgi:hypothetical protein
MLLQQRSLQDRGSTPVREQSIPRQLSLPQYAADAAAAAAGSATAAAGVRGSTVSSIGTVGGLMAGSSAHGGVVLPGQLSLYGGAGPIPAEVLTGALPLEALPALRIGRTNKHQSFMLQAIKDQVRGLGSCSVVLCSASLHWELCV